MSKVIKESGIGGEITNYYYQYLDEVSKNKTVLEQLRAADELAKVVKLMWVMRRPMGWSEEDHRANPTINDFNPALYDRLAAYEKARGIK